MVYAKILNPESYYWDWYIQDIDSKFIIDGGKEFKGVNTDLLAAIKKMIDDYDCWDYQHYYASSIKDYLKDMLPKKENGKQLSPKEMHTIKELLEKDYNRYSEYIEDIVIECLSIIKGIKYQAFEIRGCCQGDYATLYSPKNTDRKVIDYIEAVYFGTGYEIMVNDECDDVESADDIVGWTFYTAEYNTENIRKEIAFNCSCKPEEVVLYEFVGYSRTEKYELV